MRLVEGKIGVKFCWLNKDGTEEFPNHLTASNLLPPHISDILKRIAGLNQCTQRKLA